MTDGLAQIRLFHPAEEILVATCDVCGRDVGYEDGRRPQEHFRITRHPNPGAIDKQEPAVVICSRVPAGIRGEHGGAGPCGFFAKSQPAARQARDLQRGSARQERTAGGKAAMPYRPREYGRRDSGSFSAGE